MHERDDSIVSGRTRYSIGRTNYIIDLHKTEHMYDDKPAMFLFFIETISAGSFRITCTNTIETKYELNNNENSTSNDETLNDKYE